MLSPRKKEDSWRAGVLSKLICALQMIWIEVIFVLYAMNILFVAF